MIALTILAFGLLIIGAALPIGMERTRQVAELAVADSALDYAFEVIESRVRLARDDPTSVLKAPQRDNVFRPRLPGGRLAENSLPRWEPWIKVRPLNVANISVANAGSGSNAYESGEQIRESGIMAEVQVQGAWRNIGAAGNVWPYETFDPDEMYPDGDVWLPPALSALECVYPAVDLDAFDDDERYTPEFFFRNDNKYLRHPVQGTADDDPDQEEDGQETLKAMERRISWVTFYRRVSYAEGSDPTVYEFLTFVVRRPTVRHKFPVPDPEQNWDTMEPEFSQKDAALLPIPVLLTFQNDEFPLLEEGTSQPNDDYATVGTERVLNHWFQDPPTLRFVASEQVGSMLPKGSIIVPAVNGRAISARSDEPISGFVPHAPDALPLYTVVERTPIERSSPLEYEIAVASNGYYPWVDSSGASDAGEYWPFWVIPPSFETREVSGDKQPVFDGRSPIIAVDRRVIRLSEVE